MIELLKDLCESQAKARIDDLLWAAKINNDESEQIIAELRQAKG